MKYSSLHPYLPSAIALCVGLALSVAVFSITRAWERDWLASQFRNPANSHVNSIISRIRGHVARLEFSLVVLSSGHQLNERKVREASEKFGAVMVPMLRAHADVPWRALAWRVPESERAAFIKTARKQYASLRMIAEQNEQGETIEASGRAEYFPVYRVESVEKSKHLLGFDLASNSTFREAMERARQTGKPAATGDVRMNPEAKEPATVRVFGPIFSGKSPPATPEERRRDLIGFVVVDIDVGHTVETALQDQSVEGLHIMLYDHTATGNERPLYVHRSRDQGIILPEVDQRQADSRSNLRLVVKFEVAGRQWSILTQPSPAFLAARTAWLSRVSLASGLVITAFLVFFLFNFSRHKLALERWRDELELQVRTRTASLQDANRDLKRQKETQELLKELSQDITRLDVDSLLKKLTEEVCKVFEVDICDVRVRDEEVWKVMGVSGIEPEKTQSDSTATAGERSRWILDNRRPLLIPDITKTDQFSGGESIRKVGVRGYVGVPMFSRGGDVIGILRALTYGPREVSPEEVDLLQQMANGTGIALENAKLLEQTKKQAAELERAKEVQADFTAMIAHDLRSPLNNVISVAAMVEDGLLGPVNEEQKRWLAKIGTNVHNLVDLVSDFLDLSRLEAGRIDLVRQEVGLEQLIHNSVDNYMVLAQGKKISLKSNVDPALSQIKADPRRLDQVLSNLLDNAIKFTGEGGQIEVGAGGQNGKETRVWVKDTGVGIAPDELGLIFEKYRQSASGKTSSHKGTGLGLVICKMIVEAHQGRIWVESEEGKGATFYFSLPIDS